MRKLLLFAGLIAGYTSLAQQQVTKFENRVFTFPSTTELLDTINGKAIFSGIGGEFMTRYLFTTNGKAEGTRQLKSSFGATPSYFPFKVRKYGYLYLKESTPTMWRTDGNSLEYLSLSIGTTENMLDFRNQILLVSNESASFNNTFKNFNVFSWLDSLNRINDWEKDVLAYKLIDSTLHYIKLNRQSRMFELCKIDKNGRLIKNQIAEAGDFNYLGFEYITNNGREYYFVSGIGNRKLISRAVDGTGNLEISDWGKATNFPRYVRDEAKNIYFLKHDDSLSVYHLSADNQLIKKWVVSPESVRKVTEGINFSALVDFFNWSVFGDKLVFKFLTGGEGSIWYYLNRLDLQTGNYQRSKELGKYFNWIHPESQIKQTDNDTYLIDNLYNQKLTYSFLKDSVLKVETYPPNYKEIQLNGFTIQFAENAYAINGNTKVPLLLEDRSFEKTEGSSAFYHTQLAEKLLIFKNQAKCECGDLWLSNGKKDGSILLGSLNGRFVRFISLTDSRHPFFNKQLYIIVRNYYSGQEFIYETDGTKEGTKQIYEKRTQFSSLQFIRDNARQLVFKIAGNSVEKGDKLLILEDGTRWYNIAIPETKNGNNIYVTDDATYLQTLSIGMINSTVIAYNELFRISNGQLKFIDASADNIRVYRSKLYYTRSISQEATNRLSLRYTDSTGVFSELSSEAIYDYEIYGKKLVYRKAVSVASYDCTVLDLATHRAEFSIRNIYPNGITYLNDALLISYAKSLILIQNSKSREFNAGFTINIMRAFNQGLLLGNKNNLIYYDLSRHQFSVIVKGKTYTEPSLSPDGAYLIFSAETSVLFKWYYWTPTVRKVVELEDVGEFRLLNPSLIFYYNNYSAAAYIGTFSGNKFVKKYRIPYEYIDMQQKVGHNYYIPHLSRQRGVELAEIGSDSLILFPELAPGIEGIILGEVFEYMGRLYAYAYTNASGWQIWRMDSETELILDNESFEEPHRLVAYPNPVQDFLRVKTEKPVLYKLINTRGQILQQGSLQSGQAIDLRDVNPGVYLLQILDGTKYSVQKLVKE